MFTGFSSALKLTFLLLFFLVLAAGIFVPVYSDEVAIKFIYSRFFLEGAQKVSLFPQCGDSIGDELSWLFYPAAITLSIIYQDLQTLGIRLSGLIFCFSWFGLLAYWSYRQKKANWSARYALIISFSALGVLPFLWVLSRTEQLMIFTALILSFFSCYQLQRESKLKLTLGLLAITLSVSVFFFVHPKSIFFAPFAALAVWCAARNLNLVLRLALFSYVLALASQVYIDAGFISGCQAPKLKTLLSSYTLPPSLLLADPSLFFNLAWNNIINFPDRMLSHLVFSASYQSGWLPALSDMPTYLSIINAIISFLLYFFVVVPHVLILIFAIFLFVVKRLDCNIALAALFALANILTVSFYVNQSFYDGMQHVFSSILIVIFVIQYLIKNDMLSFFCFINRLHAPFYAISISSLIFMMYVFFPTLYDNSNYDLSKIPGQPTSLPVFNVSNHVNEIKKLGESCSLPQSGSEGIVLDHMTYFAYRENQRPIHILYTATEYFGVDLLDGKLIPFLKKKNSPGIIARCEWIPEEFHGNMTKSDRGYCCVNLDSF